MTQSQDSQNTNSTDDTLHTIIRQSALENALKYDGKTQSKSLLGKILGLYPQFRADQKAALEIIQPIVDEVNALSLEEQKKQLEQIQKEDPNQSQNTRKVQNKDELKELDGAKEGNIVMRFAPSPSGPMHIGHAITGGLSSLYVKKYGGKFILRIEDTNADNIDPEAFDMIVRDANWIFGNVDEVIIQSERIPIYYEFAEKLILSGHLYIDTTTPEEFKTYVEEQKDVPDKSLSPQEHILRWNKMLSGEYKEGEAVVRMKSDMAHPNPAMRDFPLLRINETSHPKQGTKYRVWPLMNFSVFVDDYCFGMTHIIRAKDHADNAKRQELLYHAIGSKPPVSYFTGRYKFEGIEISCSKTKARIKAGEFSGWSDIRIPFLEPLRRRGYHPNALLAFSKEIGLSKVDKTMQATDFFKKLDALNKDVIDNETKRFFFIEFPVELPVAINEQIELDLHPTNQKGGRKFNVQNIVLIEKEDAHALTPITRLADLANIQNGKIISRTYDEFKATKGKIIHWLCPNQTTPVTILMPDNQLKAGIAEKNIIEHIKVGDVLQFERFGFCRLDSIAENGTYNFWFGHK
jgi:glutamyl-tRNA synthetase